MSGTGLSLLGQINDPLVFIGKLGSSFALSGMFGCKTEAQGHVLAMHCVMESLSPLTIMQTYHFIEGKLSMRADAMLGLFNAAGGKHKLISRTSELAEVELTKGGETQRFALSWADAQKEPFTRGKDGGIKDNYATPLKRKQMLWARVVSDGVRAMDPGIVCGAYTPEELDDESTVPAGVIDGEFSVQKDPAPAAATVATEAKTKPKTKPKPAETAAESVAAAVASVDKPAEVAAEPSAPAAVEIPQEIRDILDLKEYVGPRWPTTKGTWEATWEKVATALSIPAGETDVERFTKMSKDARAKLAKWLNDQRVNVDKLNQAKDLTAFGNQNPAAK